MNLDLQCISVYQRGTIMVWGGSASVEEENFIRLKKFLNERSYILTNFVWRIPDHIRQELLCGNNNIDVLQWPLQSPHLNLIDLIFIASYLTQYKIFETDVVHDRSIFIMINKGFVRWFTSFDFFWRVATQNKLKKRYSS